MFHLYTIHVLAVPPLRLAKRRFYNTRHNHCRNFMIKRFLDWIKLKEILHNRFHLPPQFSIGEVWWCYVGENIGIEINGKSKEFTRPMYVYHKYDTRSFLGLSCSTIHKSGSWYISAKLGNDMQTINLAQGRVYDYRRLKERIGQMPSNEVSRIYQAYSNLHSLHRIKIDLPQKKTEGVAGNPET